MRTHLLLPAARLRSAARFFSSRRSARTHAPLWVPAAVLALILGSPSPHARAVDPAPGGGYDNGNPAPGAFAAQNLNPAAASHNTARGQGARPDDAGNGNTATGSAALYNITSGSDNTATGYAALFSDDIGSSNVATGYSALASNYAGSFNTASGWDALYNNEANNNTATGYAALFVNSSGNNNVASGSAALFSNDTGNGNTASGANALYSNNANDNTANGASALYNNTNGSANTASGASALSNNTSGYYNTASGYSAMNFNTTGSQDTADGVYALYNNTTGQDVTATGFEALYNNTTGTSNTALGSQSLFSNTAGTNNLASGYQALYNNATGGSNTASGYLSLYHNVNGYQNTAVGYLSLYRTTGSNNVALGAGAGYNLTGGSNNIAINNLGVAGESGSLRLGTVGKQTNAYVAGISGVTVAAGVPVVIDTDGHLGTRTSSERFKEAVRPMAASSEAILNLEPVSFRYKPEYDPAGVPQFGLIAEQVARVDPDLVARDAQGAIYTVRYEEVNAMLLNEFLKEHRKVEAQQGTIEQLRADLAAQQKELHDLAALVRAQATPPAAAAPRP